jgi:hypothetical protein
MAAASPAGDGAKARREAVTMALYIAICLLAALTALAERAEPDEVRVFVPAPAPGGPPCTRRPSPPSPPRSPC